MIGGSFSDALLVSPPQDRLAMLHGDGSFDNSFTSDVWGSVFALLVQPDDHIILGGADSRLSGTSRAAAWRASGPAGAVDLDFVPPALNGDVKSMMRQPDDKLLVAGLFTQAGVTAQAYPGAAVALTAVSIRISTSSSTAVVHAIALQADGRIIIGGDFTEVEWRAALSPRAAAVPMVRSIQISPRTSTRGAPSTRWPSRPMGRCGSAGYFATIAGQLVRQFRPVAPGGRWPTAQRFELADRSAVTWQRDGATAEFARVSIEQSLDGTTWTDLGAALPVTGGWSLGDLALPRNQNVWLRGSGVACHGRYNAGSRVNA